MASFSFSPIAWGGQEVGTSGTSHINNAAGQGKRAKKTGSALPQPLMGHTASSPSFETVNTFLSALQAGETAAATALLVYGPSAVSRAVGTGQIAGRRR